MTKENILAYLDEDKHSVTINNKQFDLTVIEYDGDKDTCSPENCDFEKCELCNNSSHCLANELSDFLTVEFLEQVKLNNLEFVLKENRNIF
ncbi:hypothetical protein M0Q97_11365 [Candidatus Dojkabacteria bacterium]|jgi:hypothetical protein|nr:hypothetical protein [Candidatus Dojkabacteria bacterium]